MKSKRLFFFLFIVVSVCRLLAEPIAKSDRLKFANGLYARKMYGLAEREYAAIVAEDAEKDAPAIVWFRLGECQREQQKHRLADVSYGKAASGAGKEDRELWVKATFKGGTMLVELEHYEKAAALFGKVFGEAESEALKAAALFSMGDAYLQAKETGRAVEALDAVLRIYPDEDYALYARLRLSRLYIERMEQGDSGRAEKLLKAVIKTKGSDRIKAEAHYLLAHVYYQSGHYEKSAEAFLSLRRLFPNDIRVSASRKEAVWAFFYAKQYQEAAALAGQALESHDKPVDEEWYYLLANCYRSLEEWDEAVDWYQKLVEQAPKGRYGDAARLELALIHFRAKRYKQVLSAGASSAIKGERRADLLWILAEASVALDKPGKARTCYDALIREFPESARVADARYRLAHLWQEKGELEKAVSTYLKLAAMKGKLAAKALFAAGSCQVKRGDDEAAARIWQQLVDAHPEYKGIGETRYQLGMLYVRLQKYDEALRVLGQLAKAFPKSKNVPSALYWQGRLLRKKGDLPASERCLRRGLSVVKDPQLKGETRFLLGIVLQEQAKLEEAADLFSALLKQGEAARFSSVRLAWLAEFEFKRKHYAQVLVAAEKLAANDQKAEWRETAWTLQGRGYRALGQLEKAETSFSKALALDLKTRFSAESALRLGELLAEKGETATGLDMLKRAAALAAVPGREAIRADAYMGLAKLSLNAGKKENALRFFMTVGLLFDDSDRVPLALEQSIKLLDQLKRDEERDRLIGELCTRYPESAAAKRIDKGG